MTKRPHDGLDVPTELTPGEASAVDAAVEQWGRAKARRVALRSGFNGGDLKTWRWLATGGGHCKGEEEALRRDNVAAVMIENAERLRGILRRNHRALVELTARVPQDKEDILREFDEVRASLQAVQATTHGRLLRAKAGPDQAQVRSLGRSLNDFRALLRKLEADQREVMRNSRLAALLVSAC
eukprot:CAMPEP_0179360380 /NCGR_PEP_ID=MMETSP0797-20121207/79948_1 /TAXON_ID=47934 /ORGANISM="Dinophysis acuminata, Strain DAEP01" /LENGTH=182 /DNA_ID=CAMNT_0021075735 /DNA_START=1 /DNA_END=546 /DNA_ORIENTATION=+